MLYFEQDIAPIYLKNHSGNGCQVYLQHLALCRHAWIESVNNEINLARRHHIENQL